MQIRRHLSAANVMAAAALFLSLAGTSYAAAQLTGLNIKDGTITSADVADGRLGVQSRDVKDGSLGVVDLSAGARSALKGAKGDAGAAGPTGPTGPKGDMGPSGRSSVAWATDTLPEAPVPPAATIGATASLTPPVTTVLSVVAQATVSNVAGDTPVVECFVNVDGAPIGVGTKFSAPAAGTSVAVPVVATTPTGVSAAQHAIDVRCSRASGTGTFSLDSSSINVIGIG